MFVAATWTLRKVDQKYLWSSEMWRGKRMEKVNWTDRVKSEEALPRVREEINILHTIKKKSNWIGYVLRRNCPLKWVIEGKIEKKKEWEDEEEEVISYLITSNGREVTGNRETKH